VDLAGNRPKGLILHAASELASGEIQIIDVYESRDALRTFEQSSLFPAFAAAGLGSDAQNGVLPESYEPFDLVV
jgi:hypothetical protein